MIVTAVAARRRLFLAAAATFLFLSWGPCRRVRGVVVPETTKTTLLEEEASRGSDVLLDEGSSTAANAAVMDATSMMTDRHIAPLAATSSRAKLKEKKKIYESTLVPHEGSTYLCGASRFADGVSQSRSRRRLATANYTFDGDLLEIASSSGNPSTNCSDSEGCINGCSSLYYEVRGGRGGLVTATTCDTANFEQYFYVWEGNGTCASFTCTTGVTNGCVADNLSGQTFWVAQTGSKYYVQIFGINRLVGAYTVTFTSDDPIVVSKVNVCGTSHPPPPPTQAPTGVPTVPTPTPTASPVRNPCAGGVGATYWLYDAATNAPVREIVNNSADCLLHPYNIEVRPCKVTAAANASNPIRVRLLDASGTSGAPSKIVYRSKLYKSPPYFLFGPAPASSGGGDSVLSGPKPLRNGIYAVEVKGAPEWGRLKFTQKCPCPDGTKKLGKKGCMK